MTDHDPYCQWPRVPCQCADFAAARADEREHTAFLHEALLRNQLADLRAKVEALPHDPRCHVSLMLVTPVMCSCWKRDVMRLFDGGSDE